MNREQTEAERVLCAAVWFDDGEQHDHQPLNISTGVVVGGWRHHNCIATGQLLAGLSEVERSGRHQGFITSLGRFVDREEAYTLARDAGQLEGRQRAWSGTSLCSEDLY